jgi:hypothetical protein
MAIHLMKSVSSLAASALFICMTISLQAVAATDATSWQVVGHQGVLQVVIVPREQAADVAAYYAEIAKLCSPEKTCFINFFTNTSGVQPELPLPDAIANEATARFRRSMKNGLEVLEWSCRMKLSVNECF